MPDQVRHDEPVNADVESALGAAPSAVRPALQALWGLDEALGKVLATGSEAMIGRIRLAWWREALERLDREPAPREPVLEGVAAHLLPASLTGAALAEMEEGWAAILGDQPLEQVELDTYGAKRGGLLFGFTARLLGGALTGLAGAGEAWALADLARHSSEPHDVEAALGAARARNVPARWPKKLRPLGMLAILAARDLARGPERWEEAGAPPRRARMMRHRLTGW
jgi:phytoene synthase